jgi:alpha-tubulin suppressor-like RCC1 family protein
MRNTPPGRLLGAGGAILTALVMIPAAPALAAGAAAPAAPRTVPAVVAWGGNGHGVLGDGTATSASTPVHVKLPAGQRFVTLRSDVFSLAVSASGRVYTWGFNGSGELGNGTTTSRRTPGRVRLPAGVKLKTARIGGDFALALTTGGKLLAWGYNGSGELGTGSTTEHHKPVWVRLPPGVKITAISAGFDHALALTSTGRVLSWGGNFAGQLGDGTVTERRLPGYVSLPKHTRITSLAASDDDSFATTSAGRLLAWGYNAFGELGDGSTTNRETPVSTRLPAGVKVTAASAGLFHTLALTAGHKVLAWGDNTYGQLGTGSVVSHHQPVWVRLPAGTKASALAGGEYFSVLLTTGHRILTWGRNAEGELGNGTTTDRHLPGRVHLPRGFTPTVIGAGWRAVDVLAAGRQARGK